MQEQALSRNVSLLLDALRLCRSRELYVPALLLAYVGIDILASLDPPESESKVQKRFTSWVDRYLLPGSDLPCDSVDLYAGRCAVVHTFGPESSLAAKGIARRIIYAFGESSAEEIQGAIDEIGMPDGDVAVHVDAILSAFERSVGVFREAILSDSKLRERVETNARKFFAGVSYGPSFSILDIRMG